VVFSIFNLGDRAYGPQFCAAGRKLAVRFLQLGATLLCEPGYGDDGTAGGGVFADLDLWLQETLIKTLVAKHGTKLSEQDGPDSFTPSIAYHVRVSAEASSPTDVDQEEWQLGRYAECYQSFFRRLCPLTAYRYNVRNKRQLKEPINNNNERQPPLVGRITVNERLTAIDWEQDTRHIRIQVDQGKDGVEASATAAADWDPASLPYQAGDVATILPSNPGTEVERFLQVLPSDLSCLADCEINIENEEGTTDSSGGAGCSFWPQRCTLRGWLTHCADIHALPEREDLRALAVYCSKKHEHGQDQRDKLVSLSETTEAALYADYILREKRSWVDVLYDFDSLRALGSLLDITALLTLLGPIRPREFSIASSPSREWLTQKSEGKERHHVSLELCVAVVQGASPLGRYHHGLCSHYLSKTTPSDGSDSSGSLLRLWIRPGSFGKLPLELSAGDSTGRSRLETPVLCVAAGTGIAPLRGLLLERETVRLIMSKAEGHQLPPIDTFERDNILIFGCRKETADFYYKDEWRAMEESGQLNLLTAFSQDQWHKIYVQQRLVQADGEHALLARHLLERSGSIYVAGGPKMARAVKEEIIESLGKVLDGGEKQAMQLLAKLQRLGRYSVEAWS
jgi:sulfite reductase alpha subunit-like flavoprotein